MTDTTDKASIKPLASQTRRAVFSCPEGGCAVIEFPSPLTAETLDMLTELTTLVFKSMKRESETREAREMAEAEYLSWIPLPAPPKD